MTEPLYDVVIYEYATRRIESVVGEGLRRGTGFYNAEKRAETALQRVNDRYGVGIIPTGLAGEGETLPEAREIPDADDEDGPPLDLNPEGDPTRNGAFG